MPFERDCKRVIVGFLTKSSNFFRIYDKDIPEDENILNTGIISILSHKIWCQYEKA
jgi:hypothetical protein